MVINSRRLERWAGHVARMGEDTLTGNIPLGRPRRRWENNIIKDIK